MKTSDEREFGYRLPRVMALCPCERCGQEIEPGAAYAGGPAHPLHVGPCPALVAKRRFVRARSEWRKFLAAEDARPPPAA